MAGEFEHLDARLDIALQARDSEWGARHISALRLFNGFYEGAPHLVVDLYARTLVLYWYGNDELKKPTLAHVGEYLRNHLPWVECIIEKNRTTEEPEPRWGSVVFGKDPASEIREHDVLYAIDLLMNQDASFYLDTRMLRGWLLRNANGWRVLNTFAYTGSLGVAALAGGAAHVIQVDRNPRYLELARRSGMLNRLDIGKMKLEAGDFFKKMAGFRRDEKTFDCVIIDPPFFSKTQMGVVDLVGDSMRVINKVRPLVKDGGLIIAVNNALFLSGAEYLAGLEKLCEDGYLRIEHIIPVPQDIAGYRSTIQTPPPRDPAPFNHPTKIVILGVKRK